MNSGEESALPMVVVTDLRVKQVRGPGVAGGPLEDHFSGLRVVEVVKELGLIACERSEFGQGARLLSWRSASG